ncbi:MAG: hypothetical protein Q7W54_06765 [Bacteroidota bacterium]|nr:hypothetical protein [Bacteroidota bacterium]
MTDTIMIGWPRKTGLIERFIETKTASIISRTSKAVYICHFEHSLVGHKKIVLVIPPLGELEPGFEIWLPKINTMAKELSINIFCYCNQTTEVAIQEYFRRRKHKCGFSFSDEYSLPDMKCYKNMLPLKICSSMSRHEGRQFLTIIAWKTFRSGLIDNFRKTAK